MLLTAVTAVLIFAACSINETQRPASADLAWQAVVYNRTVGAVFALTQIAPCSEATLASADMNTSGEVPTGIAAVGPIRITTPRGYSGTVSVVVTSDGDPTITLGAISPSSLPPCHGHL